MYVWYNKSYGYLLDNSVFVIASSGKYLNAFKLVLKLSKIGVKSSLLW
jgi:hypothetical protein